MLSRLPVSLIQLKAESNSKKLKKWNKATIALFVQIKKIYETAL